MRDEANVRRTGFHETHRPALKMHETFETIVSSSISVGCVWCRVEIHKPILDFAILLDTPHRAFVIHITFYITLHPTQYIQTTELRRCRVNCLLYTTLYKISENSQKLTPQDLSKIEFVK